MITKSRLLAGLNELIYVEEGMITLFANFSKELVKFTEALDEGKKAEMVKLLSRLYNDSSRHKEIVDGLIREIESGRKDEY